MSDKASQFTFKPAPHYEPPNWLASLAKAIASFFKTFGPYGTYLFWGLISLALAAILFFILRQLGYVNWQRRKKEEAVVDEWQPGEAPARKLLAEADVLAADGKFEEAAHLLLLRSFEDIDARRPTLLKPAITSREMAQSQGIPPTAREMFGTIARHVEACLFGNATLDASGWAVCRDAYKRFAISSEWL